MYANEFEPKEKQINKMNWKRNYLLHNYIFIADVES